MTLSSGTKLGRYEIRSKLGEGGMGEVYLAEDVRLHRKVALKILPADLASNKDRMRRFEQEAQAAAALNHPNIAHIYEIGESAGVNFIAMEFVDGYTLRALIHSRKTELAKLLRYLQHAAEGLAKAHAAGIVHRDLKPDNIMVTHDGHAKTLDFGLAKLIEQSHPGQNAGGQAETEIATAILKQHSTPGAILGTVGYMSPEQAQGKTEEIDHRTDIFSFGCIVYEAITGHKAFEGKDTIDSLNKIIREPAAPISNFNATAPADLQRIVRRCLAKDPEDRYQTIKDVAIEIKEVRRELQSAPGVDTTAPPSTTSVAPPSRASISSAQTISPTSSTPSTNVSSAEYVVSQIRTHKTGLIVGVSVLLLLVAGLAIGLYKLAGRNKPAISNRQMQITRLVSGLTGRAGSVSISPDGKYVAYAVWEAGKVSLWVRQVSQATSLQIFPPEEGAWFGSTAFSKDAEVIYFVAGNNKTNTLGSLYSIPVLGGREPKKIIDHVGSQVSLSPDGKQFVFQRGYGATGETAMFIANIDGTGTPRKLVSRYGEDWLNEGCAWSPDGKTIAFIGGTSKGSLAFTVRTIPADGGPEKLVTNHKWIGDLRRVLWVDEGSGLIVNGIERNDDTMQIWHITYPGGETERITNDLNEYGGVSLGVTADSSTIATILSEWSDKMWVAAPGDDEAKAKKVTNGKMDGRFGVAYLPDGRIVYAAKAAETSDLWVMNGDGSGAKPITSDAFVESQPSVSADGRYIVYQSLSPDNVPHIWRMDADGRNAKQLTSGGEDHNPAISPDGQWVVFVSWRTGNASLWKVSIDGGESTQFSNRAAYNPAFSPDGKTISCAVYDETANPPRNRPALISFPEGQLVKMIDVPATASNVRWSRDARDFVYLDVRADVANIWSMPVAGGPPKQLTRFTAEFVDDFDISPDGKHFVLSRSTGNNDIVLIKNFR